MESSSSSSSSLPTTTSGTSELFICLTSRLSSSMKITSKSILSPGRAAGGRDSSQISLSSSLNRRLKTSGSLKGGQASPAMFPTAVTGNKKKRSSCSSGFENPEPTSPKVTCIGQVRVKTKKQGKKMRYRSSKRRSNNNNNNGGEVSFRRAKKGGGEEREKKTFEQVQKLEENKWVTICEALRGFGAEFNCFLPCRSSCMTTKQTNNNDTNKVEKRISSISTSDNGRSCGAVFARWLVAFQDGDGKGREIELVVGEEEEEDYKQEEIKGNGRSLRRRVFEGIEFKEEEIMGSFNNHVKVGDNNNNVGDEGEEAGRVSICIPPKNALLLMRCRSDPVKMAALANRFWDPPLKDDQDEDEDEEEPHEDVNDEEKCENQASEICGEKCDSPCNDIGQKGAEEEEKPIVEEEEQPKMVSEKEDVEQVVVVVAVVEEEVDEVEEQEQNAKRAGTEEDFEVIVLEQRQGVEEKENNGDVRGEEEQEEKGAKNLVDLEEKVEEEVNELHSCEEHQEIEDKEIEKEEQEEERNEKPISSLASEQVEEHEEEEKVAEESTEEEEKEEEQTGRENPKEKREVEMGPPGLPDCLLLMMCEPKLSMEVSKETWVCSTDFIRGLPERRQANTKKGGTEEPTKRAITVTALDGGNDGGGGPMSNPVPPAQLMQPPRSSCSFPLTASVTAATPQSMASVIERKLVGTKPPYEPFVLTRCKSEPMRSAAKLTPDACFWKNRKIEPYRRATLGVGSAGVGF